MLKHREKHNLFLVFVFFHTPNLKRSFNFFWRQFLGLGFVSQVLGLEGQVLVNNTGYSYLPRCKASPSFNQIYCLVTEARVWTTCPRFIHLQTRSQKKGDEHPTYTPQGVLVKAQGRESKTHELCSRKTNALTNTPSGPVRSNPDKVCYWHIW